MRPDDRPHRDADAHADARPHGHSDTHVDSHADPDADAYADAHPDTHVDSHADSDADTYADAQPDTDLDPDGTGRLGLHHLGPDRQLRCLLRAEGDVQQQRVQHLRRQQLLG